MVSIFLFNAKGKKVYMQEKKKPRKVAATADNCTPHLSSVTTIRFSDFNLPVTLMGMTHEVMTWELLFILSSGVGSGRALDQLVCLSRVEGMLGMGNLDR